MPSIGTYTGQTFSSCYKTAASSEHLFHLMHLADRTIFDNHEQMDNSILNMAENKVFINGLAAAYPERVVTEEFLNNVLGNKKEGDEQQ